MKILLLTLLTCSSYAMHKHSLSVGSSPILHPRVASIREQFALEQQFGPDGESIIYPPHLINTRTKFDIDHVIDILPEVLHVEELKCHTEEVKAISKKKIAAMILAGSVTSAALTAVVTLTIHFTECQK